MQSAVAPPEAMDNPRAPRPIQNMSDAQGRNGVDLQRQRKGDGYSDIPRQRAIPSWPPWLPGQRPELLGSMCDEIGIIVYHLLARYQCYRRREAPQARFRF